MRKFLLLLVMLIASVSYAMAQKTVTGTVSSADGSVLPGVTVVLKGTTTGTVTNADGEYIISDVPDGAILQFSFVGMQTNEVEVGNRNSIDVQLSPDVIGLEEVIAVGYGTMKKSDLTGTVTRVNVDQAADMPNTNVLQALKGNVAGMAIGTPDRAGESPSLRVRGRNSISAGNSPLIVLDGIIYNGSLNNLSIHDIESVDVLKDASAAAVYGSRAANGVLIVTTKKGASSKPVFNVNTKVGISTPVKLIDVLSPDQYLQKILDYRVATNQEADPNNIHDYLTITESNNLKEGKTIDWYDELVQPAITQDYNVNISGRSERTNYFISGAYHKQEGIVQNDDFERITARANFENKITDWYTVTVRSSYSNLDYSGIEAGLYYALSPYSNWFEEGTERYELYPMEDPFYQHPFIRTEIDDYDVRNDLFGMISSVLDVPFVDGLKWTLNYSVNKRMRKRKRFYDDSYNPAQVGDGYKIFNENYDWTMDNIINYNKVFLEKHSFDATFLYSREYASSELTSARANDFFNHDLGYNALELGVVPEVSSGFGEQNSEALMGRLNYIFDDTYLLTATYRRDGFSGFAEGKKHANFFSGAFAWTVTNENFMQDISWLDRLKLRISYGENGNQAIARYQTLARMSSSRKYIFGNGGSTVTGVYVNSMANNTLGWETTSQWNLGLDFAVLNNSLRGAIDVYSSDTKDLLLRRSIPGTSGFSSIWTNIGEVHNEGIEISLNSTNVEIGDFKWESGFVFDLNRNSIVHLLGADNDEDGIEDDDIANRWFIGEPLGVYYGYDIDGIHQTGEEMPAGYQPGDFRIVDYDGDGELSPEDRHILGYSIPNYQFSISNTFTYKNFSLYVMINSIQGGGKKNYYMGNNLAMHNPNNPFSSWSERFSFAAMDYWTPDNPSNTAARINYDAPRGHSYLEDRSFVRIQDVNLSYDFSNEVLRKLQIEGLRLYVSGKNLYTFTKWTGYDPENGTTIGNFPMLRTVSFGVDLKF